MLPYSGVDRRCSQMLHWAFLVEIGVNYHRTVSTLRAISFMSGQGISPDVIARVTSSLGRRRLTRWEMQIDEAALRQALGARPLLPMHGSQPAIAERAA